MPFDGQEDRQVRRVTKGLVHSEQGKGPLFVGSKGRDRQRIEADEIGITLFGGDKGTEGLYAIGLGRGIIGRPVGLLLFQSFRHANQDDPQRGGFIGWRHQVIASHRITRTEAQRELVDKRGLARITLAVEQEQPSAGPQRIGKAAKGSITTLKEVLGG